MPQPAPVRLAISLAIIGVVLELTVSANLLTWIGVPYVSEGGSLPVKLHPGTDLLMLSSVVLVCRPGGWLLLAAERLLAAFLCAMIACVSYLLILTGTGNTVVFLDTFLPAGLLAVVLRQATPSDIVHLRRAMQVLISLNAALALVETVAQSTLVPLYLNDAAYHPHAEDFRPTALFDHPLTGSIMIMLGLALCPQRGRFRLLYSGLMWSALLAFGGRMALAASLLVTGVASATSMFMLVLHRNAQAGRMLLGGIALLISAALFAGLVLWSGLGSRFFGHLYWDESAQIRVAQWQLLERLDIWQMMFGVSRDQFLAMLAPLRLESGVEVIENFWLLMFVSLGAAGFPLFVGGLLSLLAWAWRRAELRGRLLMFGVVLVASTSNSLGRKSTVLVCLVAALACLPTRRTLRVTARAWSPDRSQTLISGSTGAVPT